jgi:Restriction endonuclease S subunits
MVSHDAGGTRKALTKGMIENFLIPKPSIDEQKAIADILWPFNDKIELNERMNRTLEEMASAIFKSWFVDFEPFQDGEFEYNEEVDKEIPKGWEVKSVHSLADYINGMAFKMYDFAAEWLPIIKIAELNNGITDTT